MLSIKYEEFLNKHKIIFAILIDLEERREYTFGSKENLAYEGLYNSLFRDMNNISQLNESLEATNMSQSWKQGELKCLVVKPNDKILVGLFYNDTQNAIESYKLEKQINNELIDLWES